VDLPLKLSSAFALTNLGDTLTAAFCEYAGLAKDRTICARGVEANASDKALGYKVLSSS